MPQGSVLGPLLIFLYVHDIEISSNKFNFYLFADDTNILYANKRLKSLELIVNQELRKLYVWLTANKLTLNVKQKPNFVIFCPTQKKLTHQPKITCDNEQNKNVTLEWNECVKYFGVLIVCYLSWRNLWVMLLSKAVEQ